MHQKGSPTEERVSLNDPASGTAIQRAVDQHIPRPAVLDSTITSILTIIWSIFYLEYDYISPRKLDPQTLTLRLAFHGLIYKGGLVFIGTLACAKLLWAVDTLLVPFSPPKPSDTLRRVVVGYIWTVGTFNAFFSVSLSAGTSVAVAAVIAFILTFVLIICQEQHWRTPPNKRRRSRFISPLPVILHQQ